MKVVGVIPARYAASRFPGKPLTMISGKTMIERVYAQASQAKSLTDVMVATDDQRIFDAVKAFGGKVIMTRNDHPTGTDRLAEVALKNEDFEVIVNVQGDEPLIDPGTIDVVAQPLLSDPAVEMATVAVPITDPAEIDNPNIVKTVLDRQGNALYFSRYPLPYERAPQPVRTVLGHIGIYAYRRDCLLRLAALEPTPLEQMEALEQLRALENGIRIRVGLIAHRSVAVDRPEDVALVEKALAEQAAQKPATAIK